MSSEEV